MRAQQNHHLSLPRADLPFSYQITWSTSVRVLAYKMATVGSSAQKAKKRNDLSLKLKYEVVKTVEKSQRVVFTSLLCCLSVVRPRLALYYEVRTESWSFTKLMPLLECAKHAKGSANPIFRCQWSSLWMVPFTIDREIFAVQNFSPVA